MLLLSFLVIVTFEVQKSIPHSTAALFVRVAWVPYAAATRSELVPGLTAPKLFRLLRLSSPCVRVPPRC